MSASDCSRTLPTDNQWENPQGQTEPSGDSAADTAADLAHPVISDVGYAQGG